MSKIKSYKCYLCGKEIGRTLEQRTEHISTCHKAFLNERHMDINSAVLLYTKLSDTKHVIPKAFLKAPGERSSKEILQRKIARTAFRIKGLKGTQILEKHICTCCNKIHINNWEYKVDEQNKIYLCPQCHSVIKLNNENTKIIYNAVATNRRRH